MLARNTNVWGLQHTLLTMYTSLLLTSIPCSVLKPALLRGRQLHAAT